MNNKLYTVVFQAGMSGVFMVWFIHQHSEFFGLKTTLALDTDDTTKFKKHVSMNGLYTMHNSSLSELKGIDTGNKHIVFKHVPHGWNWFANYDADPDINVVLLYTKHHSLADRRCDLNQLEIWKSADMHKSFEVNAPVIEKRHNTSRIDIYELIYYKNDSEYLKLCKFIGATPLPDWKQMCDDYLQLIDY